MSELQPDVPDIQVRLMTEDDLDRYVAGWLQDDEIARWFVKDKSLQDVVEKYRDRIRGESDDKVRMLCVVLDGEPAFLAQAYWLGDYPEDRDLIIAAQRLGGIPNGALVDGRTVGVDYFMNPALRGRKLSGPILHEVAATAIPGIFVGATRVVADPDSSNPASVGALLKAGFTDDGVVMASSGEDGAVRKSLLMTYTITS